MRYDLKLVARRAYHGPYVALLHAQRSARQTAGTAIRLLRNIDPKWFGAKRIILYISTAVVLSFLYGELYASRVVLDITGVPKEFEDAGVPSKVLAAHLNDELSILISAASETFPGQFNVTARQESGKSSKAPSIPLPKRPVIQRTAVGTIDMLEDSQGALNQTASLSLPDTNLSLQSLVDWLREIGLGRPVPRVQLDITCAHTGYILTVRILRGQHNNGDRTIFYQQIKDPRSLDLSPTATFLLQQLDQMTYVAYLNNSGKKDLGSVLLQDALAESSGLDLARAHNLEGMSLYAQGRYDDARQEFTKAAFWNFLSPTINEANAWHYQGYYDKAASVLKWLIVTHPPSIYKHADLIAMAHNNLAIVYIDQNNFEDAEKELALAVRYDKEPMYISNFGYVEWKRGNYAAADQEWQAALDLAPGYLTTYLTQAEAHFERGDRVNAISTIKRGLDLYDTSQGYVDWSNFLATQKDETASIQAAEDGLKQFPLDPQLLVTLGDQLRTVNRCKDAQDAYATVPKGIPEKPLALVGTAKCMVSSKQIADAKSILYQALSDKPRTPAVFEELSDVLESNGEDYSATLRQGIKEFPFDPGLHNSLGIALENRGDVSDAAAEYTTAVELNPRFVDAHANLGDTLRERTKMDAALKEYSLALDLNPKSANAHIGMGRALAATGKVGPAEFHFRAAVASDPQSKDAWRFLADFHGSHGRCQEAQKEYVNAMAFGGQTDPAVLENYAICSDTLHDYKQADMLDAQAVAIFERALPVNASVAADYANTLMNWHAVLKEMGNDKAASDKEIEAQEIKVKYKIK
jgi:tetratricopeptide (TPR) repeat protein